MTTTEDMSNIQTQTVPCTKCSAKINEACRTSTGGTASFSHSARWNDAWRKRRHEEKSQRIFESEDLLIRAFAGSTETDTMRRLAREVYRLKKQIESLIKVAELTKNERPFIILGPAE
jgi:hypothetical protein